MAIWLSAGLGVKSVSFGGADWGGVGDSLTQIKSFIRANTGGVGYDFGRGAGGKMKEVCVSCTNAGHFIFLVGFSARYP